MVDNYHSVWYVLPMANAPKRNPLRVVTKEQRTAIVQTLLSEPNVTQEVIALDTGVSTSTVSNDAQAIDGVIKEGRASFLAKIGDIAARVLEQIGQEADGQPYPLKLRTAGIMLDKWTALAYPPAHTLVQTGQIVNIHTDPDTAQALKDMSALRNSVGNRNDAANTKGG